MEFHKRDDDAPLVETMPILDIYSDGIADVDDLGDCFRTYYFNWTKVGTQSPERVLVCKIIRPKRSLLRPDGGLSGWLARKQSNFRLHG